MQGHFLDIWQKPPPCLIMGMRDIIARQHAFSAKFATPRHDLIFLLVPAAEMPPERRYLGKPATDVKWIGAMGAEKKANVT